jgi:MFS family permease
MIWTTGLLLAAVLPQYLIGAVAVAIRSDFSLTDSELGLAVGVSFAISAVTAPMAGRTVAWIGVRRGVIVSAALIMVSALGIATIADSADALIALMAVNGLGCGIGAPCFSALIVSSVSVARHGTALGLYTSAPQIAAFLAGLALPGIAEPFDWRVAFALPVAIGGVCLAALFHYAGAPRDANGSGDRRHHRPLPSVRASALAAALASAAGIGMRSFLVVFAVSVGFAHGEAGLLLAMTGLAAVVSRVGFGILGDRRPGEPLDRAAGLMLVSGFGFVLMAVGGDLAVVVGAVLAGGIGWGWQAPLSHAVVSRNPDATAAAIGLQMAGFFAGAVVGPLVLGLFAEHGSYTGAWIVCIGLSLAAASVALVTPRLVARAARS